MKGGNNQGLTVPTRGRGNLFSFQGEPLVGMPKKEQHFVDTCLVNRLYFLMFCEAFAPCCHILSASPPPLSLYIIYNNGCQGMFSHHVFKFD